MEFIIATVVLTPNMEFPRREKHDGKLSNMKLFAMFRMRSELA